MKTKKFFTCMLLISTILSIIPVTVTYFSNHTVQEAFKGSPVNSEHMQQIKQRSQIQFSLALLLFFSLLCLTLGTIFCTGKYWWIISILLTVASCCEISFIWYLIYHRGYYTSKYFTPVENKVERDSFIKTVQQNAKNSFITIPTGLFIEYMLFARKDNEVYPGIITNGIIWQRYRNDIPEEITRGIILPEANLLRLKEIFHHKNNEEEIIGWEFSATMFQYFELSQFPFDHRHIKIKILASDFEKNVILIPDFESLENTKPEDLPGINSFLRIPHWFLNKSFYSFRIQNLGTNFGYKTFNKEFPELFYYIMAHRNIWDTAVIYFILLLAAAVILFISLLAFLKHKILTGLLGFSTIGILSVCSGLLFVLISSHIEMRDNIAIDGTAYLEYLYLILYLFIILIALNSILFTLHEKIRILQYEDNLIIKLFYWPLLVNSILLVTLITFY